MNRLNKTNGTSNAILSPSTARKLRHLDPIGQHPSL